MILFQCSIEVENHAVKKNHRPFFKNKSTGRMFLGKDQRLVNAENQLIRKLREAWFGRQAFHGGPSRISEPVAVEFLFYFPKDVYFTKKGVKSKLLADLSNLYQLPEDCLQKAGILENDRDICSHDGSRRLVGDRFKLEITIRRFSDEKKT
jgi:Holliday junction resolvase RusA-like endonuclease